MTILLLSIRNVCNLLTVEVYIILIRKHHNHRRSDENSLKRSHSDNLKRTRSKIFIYHLDIFLLKVTLLI